MSQGTNPRTIATVEKCFEIVDVLKKTDGATVTELSKRIDLSVGTIHTHLTTLRELGYVTKSDTTYQLGPRLLPLGEYVRNNNTIYQVSREHIDDLARMTGECAHLIIEHNGTLIALYEAFGDNAVGTKLHRKKRQRSLEHLHCTASGKAILSRLPTQEVEEIVTSHGLVERTSSTITDFDALLDEIRIIKEQGYAVNDEEQIRGMRAVGAPVCDENNRVVSAISVSGPTTRLVDSTFHEEFPELILETKNAIELDYQALVTDET